MTTLEKDVKQLWQDRHKMSGGLSTGPHTRSAEKQDADYAERRAWLSARIGKKILNMPVMDYGCGTGRYTTMWTGKYVGVDITQQFVDEAREANPERDFFVLDVPFLPDDDPREFFSACIPRVFFTATVLQHCSDELIRKIFASLRKLDYPLKYFVLYENASEIARIAGKDIPAPAVCRDTRELEDILRLNGWPWNLATNYTHDIHGAEHRLTIVRLS